MGPQTKDDALICVGVVKGIEVFDKDPACHLVEGCAFQQESAVSHDMFHDLAFAIPFTLRKRSIVTSDKREDLQLLVVLVCQLRNS